jgi:hypothetical protein
MTEINALVPTANIVMLEGPSSVSRAILALGVRLTLEATRIVQLVGSSEGRRSLCLENEEAFKKAKLDRGKAKDEVLKAARQALGDTGEIADGSYYPAIKQGDIEGEIMRWQNAAKQSRISTDQQVSDTTGGPAVGH